MDQILENGADLVAMEIKSSSTLSDNFSKVLFMGGKDYDLKKARVLGWQSVETLSTAIN